MTTEISTLRIKAKRLGTITEVKQFLTDFENAYNSIYAFDFLVDSLSHDNKRRAEQFSERFHLLRKHMEKFASRQDIPYNPYIFESLLEKYLYRADESPSFKVLEFLNKIDIDQIVIPDDRLKISKINIQSPGFWEFSGAARTLGQIRKFIKDIWYGNTHENEMGRLKIIEEQIRILRSVGCSEEQIRPFVIKKVFDPLNKLKDHQNNGQIEGVAEELTDAELKYNEVHNIFEAAKRVEPQG